MVSANVPIGEKTTLPSEPRLDSSLSVRMWSVAVDDDIGLGERDSIDSHVQSQRASSIHYCP